MASFKLTTIPPKRLNIGINASAASFQLDNILGWNGDELTSSDFGDQAWAVFINEAKTLMEITRFDHATIASGSISFVKRGLDYGGSDTEVSANKQEWNAGETIVLLGTNPPQIYEQFVDLVSDQTIATGIKTFVTSPIVPTPSSGTQAANKDYVDGVVSAGAADGADATKGIYERATMAEIEAGTSSGSTTAPLAITSGRLGARLYTAYAADGGANDTYAITCAPAPTAYTAGMVITFKANTINTGACTVNVNALGAKAIQKRVAGGLVDLNDGDIAAGAIITAIYNGTQFELQSRISKQQVSQSGEEIYAASTSGNDTYVITLTPAPSAYVTGMIVRFKPDTANTGAASLNVNSLGAKTIKKFANGSAVDLSTGDIAANQPVVCMYDGTDMILVSASQPRPLYASGKSSRAGNAGTGDQTIAHGLGVIPRMIKVTVISGNIGVAGQNPQAGICFGNATATGTEQSSFIGRSGITSSSTTRIIDMQSTDGTSRIVGDLTTLDATNIVINFSTFSSETSATEIIWEAYA